MNKNASMENVKVFLFVQKLLHTDTGCSGEQKV
jgi:hypothetical protein